MNVADDSTSTARPESADARDGPDVCGEGEERASRPCGRDGCSPHVAQWRRTGRATLITSSALVLLFVGLLGRVVQLKLDPPERLSRAAGSAFSTSREMARRGDLVDREGRLIATSSVGYRLFLDPGEVADLRTIAAEIAHLIGGDAAEYDRKILARADRRYVVLDHLLNDVQVDAIERAGLKGVGLEPRLVREYASESLGGILVGKVGFEHTGQAGMEHRFDSRLAPQDGRFTVLQDARGRALWIEPAGYQPGEDGAAIRLSLDLVIQEIAERVLRQAVEKHNAGGGRMIVVDPETGEILALCDILRPRPGWDEFTDDPAREIHPSLGRNRCATDPYEPGSTFKPFIWAAATESAVVRIDEVLQTPWEPSYVTSRGRSIRDSHYYGPSTWETVLIKSMNSGMAIVAERLTHEEVQQAVERWGFGRRTNTGIPGESPGIVTSPRQWTHYTQTSVCMGHEIGVTALQMVQAFSAFAHDGTLADLRLTAVSDDTRRSKPVRRAISAKTAELTRRTLHKVMLEGTGRAANDGAKYRMFGKSGTAQLPKKDGRGYHENRYVSSFIAGAPLDDPRLIVLCVIDDPDRRINHWGGIVAGIPVRDVMNEALGYLGVPPDAPQTDDARMVFVSSSAEIAADGE